MTTRTVALAILLAMAGGAPIAAQRFVALPIGTWVNDITPDGSVVVGTGPGGGFYWRWREEAAPTYVGGVDAVAVSDDGTALVGCIRVDGAEVAGRWTAATGYESLGWLPRAGRCPSRSNSYDISGDGSTVIGLSWDGCGGRGFIWTAANGMEELAVLGNGTNRASTISADGSIIGGFAQGSFTRTPALWYPDKTGELFDINDQGEVNGFTDDGRLAVGTLYQNAASGYYEAFVRDAMGTITNLGSLRSSRSGNAQDISEDGKVIVGFDVAGLAREAWVWTEADGIISMNDRLAAVGLGDLPDILVCRSVSNDGNVVVGGTVAGVGGPFGFAGFIAEMSTAITLEAEPSTVTFEQFDLNVERGIPASPALVYIAAIDGVPFVSSLSAGLMNGFGAFTVNVPPIAVAANVDITFGSATLNAVGQLVLSNQATVSFR